MRLRFPAALALVLAVLVADVREDPSLSLPFAAVSVGIWLATVYRWWVLDLRARRAEDRRKSRLRRKEFEADLQRIRAEALDSIRMDLLHCAPANDCAVSLPSRLRARRVA